MTKEDVGGKEIEGAKIQVTKDGKVIDEWVSTKESHNIKGLEENNEYVVGLIIIHPNYRGKGVATNIIKEYIDIAKKNNKNIKIKTYKYNPAKKLYERLGFKIYSEDDTHVYLKIVFSI